MSENAIIVFNNYTKKFKNEVVLNKINLEFIKGKCYGIVGRNGSGKSVLFKAICGYIMPTDGNVIVNGKTIGVDADFPDNTGALIEKPDFLQRLTGVDNLMYLASINNKISKREVLEVLNLVELKDYDTKLVKNYSVGMKQRLGIAQAIMENQEIIILDEPMTGLDKQGVVLVKSIIKSLIEKGKTVILSSHIDSDINDLCSKVYEIEGGNIEELIK
ncbi:MAG: ABC transporter ATP-binding protein [Clostridium sp.]